MTALLRETAPSTEHQAGAWQWSYVHQKQRAGQNLKSRVQNLKSGGLLVTAKILKMAAAGDEQPNPDAPVVTFDMFYARYPRKMARKVAQQSWARIDSSEHQSIMEALERHRKSPDWRKQGGMFIPYPATWLNQERWTDSDEVDDDLTMGQCYWNSNGTREPGKPRCTQRASKEKGGVVYCATHAVQVN